jgi:cystathionine beta-lyase/cystathionine gamma-synthase
MFGQRPETVAIHAGRPARVEGGTAIAFGSGMAAISAVLETLPAGSKVVGPAKGYAWTRSLLERHADAGRLELARVDTTDTAATLAACEGARLLYVETPSNPLAERLAERHVVHYPGLASDPGPARATRLMDGYGAMLSFEHGEADAMCRRVGCEHVEDLWSDLEQAL